MHNRFAMQRPRYTVEDVRPSGCDQIADVDSLNDALAIAHQGRGRYGTQVIRWDGKEPACVIRLDPLADEVSQ